jgi:hypothetical protein
MRRSLERGQATPRRRPPPEACPSAPAREPARPDTAHHLRGRSQRPGRLLAGMAGSGNGAPVSDGASIASRKLGFAPAKQVKDALAG